MTERELTPEQMVAIVRGINLGKTLQKDHLEIAELYGQDYTLSRIVEELSIPSNYGVSYNVARTGVRLTISGYGGGFNIDSYDGLINVDEREIISRKHMRESGRRTGRRLYEEKRGIHGRTHEQMIEDGRKGGRIGGLIGGSVSYEKRVGIHGRTHEQHSEDGRKGGHKVYEQRKGWHGRTHEQIIEDGRKGGRKGGLKAYEERKGYHGRTPEQMIEDGRKSAVLRGQIPWTDEEIKFAYLLSEQPEYQWGEECYNGKPNFKKIIKGLIEKGYPNRTGVAVSIMVSKHRRSLEGRV